MHTSCTVITCGLHCDKSLLEKALENRKTTYTREQDAGQTGERRREGWMNNGKEQRSVMKAVEEVIVSHAWRDKVVTLIKK